MPLSFKFRVFTDHPKVYVLGLFNCSTQVIGETIWLLAAARLQACNIYSATICTHETSYIFMHLAHVTRSPIPFSTLGHPASAGAEGSDDDVDLAEEFLSGFQTGVSWQGWIWAG